MQSKRKKRRLCLKFAVIMACTLILVMCCNEWHSSIKVKAEKPLEVEAQTVILPETIETKEYRYIDGCPLSEELQQGIYDICENCGMSFELVMAVIEHESSFNTNAIGDNGNSKGLMQIQEKWHYGLMAELGVTDLLDPLGNVKVGVTLLNGYIQEGNGIYYALMKYNGGGNYANGMIKAGKVSSYALEVTETAKMYEEQNGI